MQVRVLGTLEVDDDQGRPIAVTGAKQRALLALLAAEVGQAVSTDRLIDLLCGDAPPSDAGNALRHQVSRLR
jgi:DNA-binding SARP family transcriptional activator